MKKILMSSLVLLTFSTAVLIFQLSCKKEANAQTMTESIVQLDKIIYVQRPHGEIWTANYDGTDKKKINVAVPAGITVGDNVRLSPDGKTIFFEGDDSVERVNHIYSCKIDGSNVKKIIDGSSASEGTLIGGAY